MWNRQKKLFWLPLSWKWGLVLLLVAASAFLLWKLSRRPVKVELLPFTDSPPAWDCSYPYAVFSPVAGLARRGLRHFHLIDQANGEA
jgi:hypothetical protein